MSGKIYIGSSEVFADFHHLYLLYDPDTDNDNDPTTGAGVQIIRGGPENNNIWDWGMQ